MRLTQPDFSKLACSQTFIQFQGLTWDLPGIFLPRFLRFGTQTGNGERLAQPIALLCRRKCLLNVNQLSEQSFKKKVA